MNPLTSVLIKIFVKGFYRAHSGMFLFFFVAVVTYCFFIEVLNKTHLPPSSIAANHLIVVLAVITSPVVLIFVATLWLAYTVKTWQYVKMELGSVRNQFLYYSSNSLPTIVQFRSWLIAQLIVSAPMIIYSFFALIVGLIFSHYLLPILFIAYVILIAVISAIIHVARANSFRLENRSLALINFGQTWRKPFFTFYLFQILNGHRIGFAVTKLLSFGVLLASSYLLLREGGGDLIVGGIITLGIVVTHCFLIFDSYCFEKSFLAFSRNLPYSKTRIYYSWAICYLVLTLPETIWLLYKFEVKISLVLLALNLVTGLLYRTALYKISITINAFLRIVFITFILFFLGILMKLTIPILALNLILSIFLFNKYYYKQESHANEQTQSI